MCRQKTPRFNRRNLNAVTRLFNEPPLPLKQVASVVLREGVKGRGWGNGLLGRQQHEQSRGVRNGEEELSLARIRPRQDDV